jgi:hypothetical protein
MNAWDKSQELIKFGRNTYQDQLEKLVTVGKVTEGDLKKCEHYYVFLSPAAAH